MKKISIVFSFILLFVLVLTPNVNAADTSSPYSSIEDTIYYKDYTSKYVVFKDTTTNKYFGFIVFCNKGDGDLSNVKITHTTVNGKDVFGVKVLQDQGYTIQVRKVKYTTYWEHMDVPFISATSPFTWETTAEVLETDTIIYDAETDEPFFPVPPIVTPEEILAETLEEETQKTAEKVIQTMKTIVLCGVGCLAFLICLPTLVRTFSIFRLKS